MAESDQESVDGQPGWITQRLELLCRVLKLHNCKIHVAAIRVNDISSIIELLICFSAFLALVHLISAGAFGRANNTVNGTALLIRAAARW